MYIAGVLVFLISLVPYVASRRSEVAAKKMRRRGISYLLLGAALELAPEGNEDVLSWAVRAFGLFVLVQGARCLALAPSTGPASSDG